MGRVEGEEEALFDEGGLGLVGAVGEYADVVDLGEPGRASVVRLRAVLEVGSLTDVEERVAGEVTIDAPAPLAAERVPASVRAVALGG